MPPMANGVKGRRSSPFLLAAEYRRVGHRMDGSIRISMTEILVFHSFGRTGVWPVDDFVHWRRCGLEA
jgi:hypothetical protein